MHTLEQTRREGGPNFPMRKEVGLVGVLHENLKFIQFESVRFFTETVTATETETKEVFRNNNNASKYPAKEENVIESQGTSQRGKEAGKGG